MCRGKIERNIAMIAQNQRTKEAVLHEAIDHFSRDFRAACQSQGRHADN